MNKQLERWERSSALPVSMVLTNALTRTKLWATTYYIELTHNSLDGVTKPHTAHQQCNAISAVKVHGMKFSQEVVRGIRVVG